MRCKLEEYVNVIQWTGHNKDEIIQFCGEQQADVFWNSFSDEYGLNLNTANGPLMVSIEDYVVKFVNGSVWAMNKFDFEKEQRKIKTEPKNGDNFNENTQQNETISIAPCWQERMQAEYHDLKTRYEKLHRMVTKYEAGTLDFTPNCSLDLLRQQKRHMGEYLHDLEIRAEVEGIEL